MITLGITGYIEIENEVRFFGLWYDDAESWVEIGGDVHSQDIKTFTDYHKVYFESLQHYKSNTPKLFIT